MKTSCTHAIRLTAACGLFVWSTGVSPAEAQGLVVSESDIAEVQTLNNITMSRYGSGVRPPTSLRRMVPVPGDQNGPGPHGYRNSTNSCVGWTVGYGLLSSLDTRWRTDPRNPIYVFHSARALRGYEPSNQNGCEFGDAFMAISARGSCGMADYTDPHEYPRNSFVTNYFDTRKRLISNRLSRTNLINEIKNMLDGGGGSPGKVVPCGFAVPTNFLDNALFDRVRVGAREEYLWNRTRPGIDTCLHAMLVVGYNDNVGQVGAFEVMNSYGPGFANDGFIWIGYDFFAHPGETSSVLDNPCCTVAFRWEIGVDLYSQQEVAELTAEVAAGRQEAWARLEDRNGAVNFVLPEGGITALAVGDEIAVSRAIAPDALALKSELVAFKSANMNRNTGRKEIITDGIVDGIAQVGAIGRDDKIEVTDLKQINLLDGSGRTEVWVRGKVLQR